MRRIVIFQMRSSFSHSFKSRGFTLIELLVAISVSVVLLAMLVSVIGGVRERANMAKSSSHLRQCGSALLLLAQGNQGVLEIRVGGSVGGGSTNRFPLWAQQLHDEFGIAREFFQDVRVKPYTDGRPDTWAFTPAYGLNRIAGVPGALPWETYMDGRLRIGKITLHQLDDPSNSFMLATSMYSDGRGGHSIDQLAAGNGYCLQNRFDGKALMFFFDGRVGAVGPKELSEMGFQSAYGHTVDEVIQFN